MNDKEKVTAVVACMACLFVGLAAGAGAGAMGEMKDINEIYRQAAEHGAGQWVADPKTGKTAWVWTGK